MLYYLIVCFQQMLQFSIIGQCMNILPCQGYIPNYIPVFYTYSYVSFDLNCYSLRNIFH